jgi:hypothetical protein
LVQRVDPFRNSLEQTFLDAVASKEVANAHS